MKLLNIYLRASLAAALLSSPALAQCWTESSKLVGSGSNRIGERVALSGDTAVFSNANGEAKVYVFRRDAPQVWSQVAELTPSDGIPPDAFGEGLAVAGDTILVGAPYHSPSGLPNAGAVYVYGRDQGGPEAWGEVRKLTPIGAQKRDYFGWSVAVDGDLAAIGSPNDTTPAGLSGSAYIFERDLGGADNWGERTKLYGSNGGFQHEIGHAVSISGDMVAISAWGNHEVYVRDRNLGGTDNWGERTVIKAPPLILFTPNAFGYSISLSGDSLAVGAFTPSLPDKRAFVYDRDQGGADNWGMAASLENPTLTPGEKFGFSVALSGDRLAVGAPGDSFNHIGSAYIYERDLGGPGAWSQATFLPSQTHELFASSLAFVSRPPRPGRLALQLDTRDLPGPHDSKDLLVELLALHPPRVATQPRPLPTRIPEAPPLIANHRDYIGAISWWSPISDSSSTSPQVRSSLRKITTSATVPGSWNLAVLSNPSELSALRKDMNEVVPRYCPLAVQMKFTATGTTRVPIGMPCSSRSSVTGGPT